MILPQHELRLRYPVLDEDIDGARDFTSALPISLNDATSPLPPVCASANLKTNVQCYRIAETIEIGGNLEVLVQVLVI